MKNDKKIWSISIWSNGNLIGILEFDAISKYDKTYGISYYGHIIMVFPIESFKGKLKKAYGCNGISKTGHDVRGYHLKV